MSTVSKIIVEGITESGEKFRPSDWAERMGGFLCTLHNQRIVYSPLLQPILKNGYQCIAIDPLLQEQNPELYESIMLFAQTNKLKIYTETQHTNHSDH